PRLPEFSQIVTGVVRGRPLLRPRTVISTSGPIGTPAAKRSRAMGLKNGTHDGTPVDLPCAAMIRNLLTQSGDSRDRERGQRCGHLPQQVGQEKRRIASGFHAPGFGLPRVARWTVPRLTDAERIFLVDSYKQMLHCSVGHLRPG